MNKEELEASLRKLGAVQLGVELHDLLMDGGYFRTFYAKESDEVIGVVANFLLKNFSSDQTSS